MKQDQSAAEPATPRSRGANRVLGTILVAIMSPTAWAQQVSPAAPAPEPTVSPISTPAATAQPPAAPTAAIAPQPAPAPALALTAGQPRLRSGLTFQAAASLGALYEHDNLGGSTSDGQGVIGGAAGIGGFLTPDLALLGRVSLVRFGLEASDGIGTVASGSVINVFLGPWLQYWAGDHLWVAAGLGVARNRASLTGSGTSTAVTVDGWGLDFGIGTAIGSGPTRFSLGFDFTPTFFEDADVGNYNDYSVTLQLGLQSL